LWVLPSVGVPAAVPLLEPLKRLEQVLEPESLQVVRPERVMLSLLIVKLKWLVSMAIEKS
jgi:hypothetical protein